MTKFNLTEEQKNKVFNLRSVKNLNYTKLAEEFDKTYPEVLTPYEVIKNKKHFSKIDGVLLCEVANVN